MYVYVYTWTDTYTQWNGNNWVIVLLNMYSVYNALWDLNFLIVTLDAEHVRLVSTSHTHTRFSRPHHLTVPIIFSRRLEERGRVFLGRQRVDTRTYEIRNIYRENEFVIRSDRHYTSPIHKREIPKPTKPSERYTDVTASPVFFSFLLLFHP